MKILATGGAGYIGSHTCLELLQAGHEVVAVDNLSNSKAESLKRVQEIAGRSLSFCRADLLDRMALAAVFRSHEIEAVLHFAGLKAVGESVRIPLRYYHNNITGTLTLCEVMKEFGVFGNDYPTPDGTGVRDYIHVVDLARGHLRALEKLRTGPGLVTYNLGTGRGYSVLEAIAAFSQACGKSIPHRIVSRRPGDVASSYADPALARRELGWQATRGLGEMCADGWRWQSGNPYGYD